MNYYWIDFWDDKTKQSKRNNYNIGKNIIAQYQQNRNNYNIKDNSFVVNLATALNMTKGSSECFYIVLIPTSNNIAIRLRLSNHPSSSSEWVRHEINGVPNIRYSIWIGDFKGEDSHKIKKEPLTYVANGVKVVEYGYNKQFLNSNELRIDLFNTLQSIYNLTSISESKQIIRLTESDLHEIIKESVTQVLMEYRDSNVWGWDYLKDMYQKNGASEFELAMLKMSYDKYAKEALKNGDIPNDSGFWLWHTDKSYKAQKKGIRSLYPNYWAFD